MKKQDLKEKLKKNFLKIFQETPGLREGDAIPPKWYLREDFLKLNQVEKELLDEGIKELIKEELITESYKITKKGIEYITFNL